MKRVLTLSVTLALAACDHASTGGGNPRDAASGIGAEAGIHDDSGPGAGGDVSAATDGSDGGNLDPSCPATVPVEGSPCAPIFQECEYAGSDPKHDCNVSMTCLQDQGGAMHVWVKILPRATCGTHPAPCPDTFFSLPDNLDCSTAVNSPSPVSCDYDEGRCGCVRCGEGFGTGWAWSCRRWATGGTGCPALAPPSGSACEMPGQACYYGDGTSISVGLNLECRNGRWTLPVSPPGTPAALRACAVCMPGADQSCNGDTTVSTLEGRCTSEGACVCNAPYSEDSETGLCTAN
jgi:hypothetical protein